MKLTSASILRTNPPLIDTSLSLVFYLTAAMSSVEVTAVVASIVSAFASGMDIFRRMKARQRPKKSRKTSDRLAQEEYRLEHSLESRPREIRAEYDRSLARLGDRFAVGDSTAQTSLNHTLLLLNTGLIQILAYALSNDSQAQALSRQSLLDLSETAAADAVRALEQLQDRLSSTSQLKLNAPPPSKKRLHRKGEEVSRLTVGPNKARPVPKPRAKSFSSTERKRPGPDPLIRGAWVRSKSGTSVITASSLSCGTPAPRASDSNLKAASASLLPHATTVPRPSHHRTTSSPSYTSRPDRDGLFDRARKNSVSSLGSPPPSYAAIAEPKKLPYPSRQPSLLIASAEVFKDPQVPFFQPTPSQLQPPPPPPKIPLHNSIYAPYVPSSSLPAPAAPLPATTMRRRPPSVATFLTTSTKIGEIPEHKWRDRRPFTSGSIPGLTRAALPWEEQHDQKPIPYMVAPRPGDDAPPKRKGRGIRFWKRSEQIGVS